MSTVLERDPTLAGPRDPRGRSIATGAALVGAPLLLVAGNLLGTPGDSSTAAYMSALAASNGAEQISIVCFLLGFTAFVPAAFGLVGGGRGRTLGLVGAWLTAIGATAYAGLVCSGITNIGLATSLPAGQAAHLASRMGDVGAAGAVFALALALPVGVVLSASGWRRARRTPLWVPIVTALGFVTVILVESTAGGIAGDLLMLAGLGYAGIRRATGRDA